MEREEKAEIALAKKERREPRRSLESKLLRRESNLHINMALEVFVVHWRALIEFLYFDYKKFEDDDVRAYDFTDKNNSKETRGEIFPCFEGLKIRADKEVADITRSRKYEGDPEKDWPYKEMKTELENK